MSPAIEQLENELKHLIVKCLSLEDVTADEIVSEAPLFGDGLGLDSIDALEIAMALDRSYNVEIRAGDASNRATFFSVRSLAQHVHASVSARSPA